MGIKRLRIKQQSRKLMDFIIAGIIAAALLAYLIYAMLHPEQF